MSSNIGFQKFNIEKMFEKEGVRKDQIDLESELDPQLTMSENIDRLEEEFDLGLRSNEPRSGAEAKRRNRASGKKQAISRNQARSDQAILTDDSKQAEKVFEEPVSNEEFELWADNPSEYDIEGVDTKEII